MTPAPTPKDAARLRTAILRERGALDRAASRVEIARVRSASAGSTFIEHSALGKALDDVYQAGERIFQSIAKEFEDVPEGAGWHSELLENMRTPVPSMRPAVLAPVTALSLRELLGFRHRFRNVYGEDLDPVRLDALAGSVPRTITALTADLGAFDRFLEKLAADASD